MLCRRTVQAQRAAVSESLMSTCGLHTEEEIQQKYATYYYITEMQCVNLRFTAEFLSVQTYTIK